MLHRLRDSWGTENAGNFDGSVEFGETYFGGKRANMSNSKRREMAKMGSGPAGKEAVVGIKDRKTNKVAACQVMMTDMHVCTLDRSPALK